MFLGVHPPMIRPLGETFQKIDELLSIKTYSGNGTSLFIPDGFDPDLVWTKARTGPYASDASFGRHTLVDRVRGTSNDLASNLADAQIEYSGAVGLQPGIKGHNVYGPTKINDGSSTFVSWAFKRAQRFFDIVTYVGNGSLNRQITTVDSLGKNINIGLAIVKATNQSGDWYVSHLSLDTTGINNGLKLNSTKAYVYGGLGPGQVDVFNNGNGPGSLVVSQNCNISGVNYVAYLFAHDPDPIRGLIQCGKFTVNGTYPIVNLPWPTQLVIAKSSSAAGNWFIVDTVRGIVNGNSNTDKVLCPNTSDSEVNACVADIYGNTLQFNNGQSFFTNMADYVYLAIRSPQ